MRWGVEVWDRFEDVSGYVHKGIEFCERYEEFLKKRCSIENTYAKSLRKLIESYEPKKKEVDENDATYLKCFIKILDELRDVAGQHELVAENFQDSVLSKINQVVRGLKDERRKCIDDKEKYYSEYTGCEELLEKCKQKYEKSYKEVEKAEELLNKVENDDSASKNDIKKQKNICDQKKRQYDTLEAEYARQLCETNRVKNLYYFEQLPAVFDNLQNIEKKRIENFRDFVGDCVKIEIDVLPRIRQCFNEIDSSAKSINPDQDTTVAVRMYKTGYNVPLDHIFEDLKLNSLSQNSNHQLNGSINSNGTSNTTNNSNGSSNNYSVGTLSVNSTSSTSNSRNKKYRTLHRIKGLFNVSSKTEQESLYDLPPQQLKNELLKKMNACQFDLEKQQKEREGLLKLKDIYSKNKNFGDSQSAESALKLNDEKIYKLTNELKKYQEIYSQVEQQYSEYSSSGGSGSGSSVGTLPRDVNAKTLHIYQSPSQSSVNSNSANNNNNLSNNTHHPYNISNNNSSFPGTPVTPHYATNTNGTPSRNINNNSELSAVAYAVSPVSHLNATNGTSKMAPLVNSNNNESFDDDDDLDDDDDDDNEQDYEENGGYESPASALRNGNHQIKQPITNGGQQSSPITAQTTLITGNKMITNITDDSKKVTTNTTSIGFVYATEPQYDQVDACLYDQPATSIHDEPIIGTALVMYAFDGNVQNSISIQENESLNVLEKDSGDGWTLVKRLNGEKGYVPTDYIQIVYY